MRIRTTGPGRPRGSLTTEAVGALRALGADGAPPIILGYHPVPTQNPFPDLLYRGAWDARIAPLPVYSEEEFDELVELARLDHRVVLHLHWLNRPLGRAATAEAARQSGQAFLGRLDVLHAAGGRVAWTVHNLLPHAARFEAEERWFRGEVARRADAIHVMAATTPQLVAPLYDLPADRIIHVPHPSYVGAYADIVSRGQARHELGIMPDELVYLVIGAIQPYKGIGELLDAWDALPASSPPRRLVIAGGPTREPGVDELVERAALHPGVLLHPERIESDRMQVFLRAADVAVLPYLRALNSGALMLACSFDLPVIVPAGGGLAEIVDPRMGRTFEPGDRASLVAALLAGAEIATPEGRSAAREKARGHDAAMLSRAFADALRGRLGWNDAAP